MNSVKIILALADASPSPKADKRSLLSFLSFYKCKIVMSNYQEVALWFHNESVKPMSLPKDLDLQLEEDGVTKSLSLYKEEIYKKAGCIAGTVLDCPPKFQKILEKTTCNNLQVQACCLCVESEYISAAFKALHISFSKSQFHI